ncbi:hypothetical protein BDN72DRAFT_862729 [Pluteus cervinus]|uniref:Uncharacterized protein n=1 Tax=Pluteus cervinus TaxID=181527 RepID=A0ACD3AA87_9AGAR|nr:hypothetical protein BDN72DRAFT_862729 [Pluteus cervinus]
MFSSSDAILDSTIPGDRGMAVLLVLGLNQRYNQHDDKSGRVILETEKPRGIYVRLDDIQKSLSPDALRLFTGGSFVTILQPPRRGCSVTEERNAYTREMASNRRFEPSINLQDWKGTECTKVYSPSAFACLHQKVVHVYHAFSSSKPLGAYRSDLFPPRTPSFGLDEPGLAARRNVEPRFLLLSSGPPAFLQFVQRFLLGIFLPSGIMHPWLNV